MTDLDDDSRMRGQDDSVSEHSSRSSSIFPYEAEATPPQSQPSNVTAAEKRDVLMAEAGDQGYQPRSAIEGAEPLSQRPNATGNTLETDEKAPGYAWRNRRAVEEYEKALDLMQDKHFSLEEFGDLVLEQLQEKQADYDPYAQLDSANEDR